MALRIIKQDERPSRQMYSEISTDGQELIIHIPLSVQYEWLAERAKGIPIWQLTKRERTIIKLLQEGKVHKEISNELHIAVRTVKFHTSNILRKLHVENMSELFRYYSPESIRNDH